MSSVLLPYVCCRYDATKASLSADIDQLLRPFAKLGLDYVKQLSAWDSADVSTALADRKLDLHGTLRTLAEQKQRLFDAYLITWELRINDSYTPKDEAVKQLFSTKARLRGRNTDG